MTTVLIDGRPAFPGRYLKAEDLMGRDVHLTIASVRIEALRDPRGRTDEDTVDRYIMRFEELSDREGTDHPHLFVLNKTNASAIAAVVHEPEMTKWQGKRITLHPERVKAFGQMVDGIRVRSKAPPVKVAESGPEPKVADELESYRSTIAAITEPKLVARLLDELGEGQDEKRGILEGRMEMLITEEGAEK